MESHFRSSAFVLSLIFILPGLLVALLCASAPEFLLGYLYEHGEGTERDYAKAAENYQAAAGKGHAAAANNLAFLYHHGTGVPKDLRKALELLLASAQAGDSVGQCNLALMYYHGDGTARNYALAAKWFRAAAEQDNAHAEHGLG